MRDARPIIPLVSLSMLIMLLWYTFCRYSTYISERWALFIRPRSKRKQNISNYINVQDSVFQRLFFVYCTTLQWSIKFG